MKPGDVVVLEDYDPEERVMLDGEHTFNYMLKEFHLHPGTITKVIQDLGTNFILIEAAINDKFKPHFFGIWSHPDHDCPSEDGETVEIWCRKCIFKRGDKGDKFLYTMNNGVMTPEN